jgi:hypothetical protein
VEEVANLSNNSRYSRITHRTFWRIPVGYIERERKKIVSFFPIGKQDVALEETKKHISTLVSWLFSETAPKKIKRNESIRRIQALQDDLQSLENHLGFFLQQGSHQNTIELKNKFYSCIRPEYPRITLQSLSDLILYLRLACKGMIRNPGRPGRKDQAYYEAVENLAFVWKKYAKKEPTLHNKSYKIDEYAISQRPSGPFLGYLDIAIKSAIRHTNMKRKKKISLDVSLPNIARDVIRLRKKSMAKISSK